MPKPNWRNTPVGNMVVIGLAVIVVLALVWVVRGTGAAKENSAQQSADGDGGVTPLSTAEGSGMAPAIGELAPTFQATAISGKNIAVPAENGQPTWVVFNATWCSNCRAEIPDIQEAFLEYGDEVEIVSIYVSDTRKAVENYSEKLGLSYPQIVDERGEISAEYRVLGLPTHYFVDGAGLVEAIDVGTLSKAQIEERIRLITGR